MGKFELGQVVMTRNVAQSIKELGGADAVREVVARHHAGDWGDVEPEDWKANDDALAIGSRIISAYMLNSRKVWVITEAEVDGVRGYTTILFPEDY